MKYYQISPDSEPEIIGVKNGIYQVEINKDEILKQQQFKEFITFFKGSATEVYHNQDRISNFIIPPIKGKMLKKAKVTDIMGYTQKISFIDYLYSSKYINLLKEYKLPDHYIFDVNIDAIDEKYYMLFVTTILLKEINYGRSVIYTGHKVMNNVKYYSIQNYCEYLDFREHYPICSFEKISIPKKYSNVDLISIQASRPNFYSGKLLNRLLNNGITGLSYNSKIELDFY